MPPTSGGGGGGGTGDVVGGAVGGALGACLCLPLLLLAWRKWRRAPKSTPEDEGGAKVAPAPLLDKSAPPTSPTLAAAEAGEAAVPILSVAKDAAAEEGDPAGENPSTPPLELDAAPAAVPSTPPLELDAAPAVVPSTPPPLELGYDVLSPAAPQRRVSVVAPAAPPAVPSPAVPPLNLRAPRVGTVRRVVTRAPAVVRPPPPSSLRRLGHREYLMGPDV